MIDTIGLICLILKRNSINVSLLFPTPKATQLYRTLDKEMERKPNQIIVNSKSQTYYCQTQSNENEENSKPNVTPRANKALLLLFLVSLIISLICNTCKARMGKTNYMKNIFMTFTKRLRALNTTAGNESEKQFNAII